MLKLNKISLFCILVANCVQAFAVTSFEQKMNKLIAEGMPNSTVGIVLQDPKNEQIIYANRGSENFYPASNTKLLTASAALKFFGPDFQYQTGLYANLNKVEQGVLKDNIYLIFRGDPSLTMQDIAGLMKQLKAKGVNQIQGNIVIDDRSFVAPAYAPGWTWDSIPWYFSAPVTSIIINENKVRLKLNKPEKLYDIIKVEQIDENVPSMPLQSSIMVVTPEEAKNVCQLTAVVRNNALSLNGCWPLDKTPTNIELAIDNPRDLAKKVIQQFLPTVGLKLTGDIAFGKTPKDLPLLAVKKSPPLKVLLYKVLAESNNIYTESLTKALGKAFGGQGSFQAGTIAIQEILKKDAELDFTHVNLSDGSGQSRYNLMSPAFISKLLLHMYRDPNFNVFYSALSVGGKQGSLGERFKGKEQVGKVVAKTGTANGTSAISGYITGNSGNVYSFSLMINQSAQNMYALKAFEDKLCQLIIEEPWLATSTTAAH